MPEAGDEPGFLLETRLGRHGFENRVPQRRRFPAPVSAETSSSGPGAPALPRQVALVAGHQPAALRSGALDQRAGRPAFERRERSTTTSVRSASAMACIAALDAERLYHALASRMPAVS